MYLRARYYVPGLGVFPSLDPVEEGNRFGYVGGDVVNRVDPSGMIGERPPEACNVFQLRKNPCTKSDACRSLTSPCDNWSGHLKTACQLVESDPQFTRPETADFAVEMFSFIIRMSSAGFGLGFAGDEFRRSMAYYADGAGEKLNYDPQWYMQHSYAVLHKNKLLNWLLETQLKALSFPTPLACAQVFVGSPAAHDPNGFEAARSDLRYTFGRHYLKACATTTTIGNLAVEFLVQDRFDFDPEQCIPPVAEALGIGCIPQDWWVQLAAIGRFGGAFDQEIHWSETIECPIGKTFDPSIGDTTPNCSTETIGFCPQIKQISNLENP